MQLLTWYPLPKKSLNRHEYITSVTCLSQAVENLNRFIVECQISGVKVSDDIRSLQVFANKAANASGTKDFNKYYEGTKSFYRFAKPDLLKTIKELDVRELLVPTLTWFEGM